MVRCIVRLAAVALLAWPAPALATEAWFASLVRAESAMTSALTRGEADSAAAVDVLVQARLGAEALSALLGAPTAAESLLAGSWIAPPPPSPPRSPWGDRFMRATHVVGIATHLLNLAGSWYGMSHETHVALGYVGGGAGGAGAVFNLVRPRHAPPPPPDPHETIRTISREWMLRETCGEAEERMRALVAELRGLVAAPAATAEQRVELARRYASALSRAQAVIDHPVTRAAAAARSASTYAPFSGNARDRLAELAGRYDAIVAAWHERRALVTRSERNALAYLVLADRP